MSATCTTIDYEPATGVFRWRISRGKVFQAGDAAGYIRQNGRRQIEIDGSRIRAANLAWFYVTGVWPQRRLDHKDCNSANDAFSNLRECTDSENTANRRKGVNNTTGFKGVVRANSGRAPYRAQISCKGKYYSLGSFADPKEAHAAYVAKARELFGEFARAG